VRLGIAPCSLPCRNATATHGHHTEKCTCEPAELFQYLLTTFVLGNVANKQSNISDGNIDFEPPTRQQLIAIQLSTTANKSRVKNTIFKYHVVNFITFWLQHLF